MLPKKTVPRSRSARHLRAVQSARRLVPCFVRGSALMTDGPLRRLFWRVADQLDYLVTLAWLRILDALAGPLPETPADREGSETRKR